MRKLFRRLIGFHGDPRRNLAEFTAWLAEEKPEQVVDSDDEANFTNLDNLVEVNGSQIRMTRPPHRIVVVSRRDGTPAGDIAGGGIRRPDRQFAQRDESGSSTK